MLCHFTEETTQEYSQSTYVSQWTIPHSGLPKLSGFQQGHQSDSENGILCALWKTSYEHSKIDPSWLLFFIWCCHFVNLTFKTNTRFSARSKQIFMPKTSSRIRLQIRTSCMFCIFCIAWSMEHHRITLTITFTIRLQSHLQSQSHYTSFIHQCFFTSH